MIEQAFPTSYSSHSNYFKKRVHDRDSDCRIIVPFHKLRTYVYGYWIVHYNYILLYHKVAITLTHFFIFLRKSIWATRSIFCLILLLINKLFINFRLKFLHYKKISIIHPWPQRILRSKSSEQRTLQCILISGTN